MGIYETRGRKKITKSSGKCRSDTDLQPLFPAIATYKETCAYRGIKINPFSSLHHSNQQIKVFKRE